MFSYLKLPNGVTCNTSWLRVVQFSAAGGISCGTIDAASQLVRVFHEGDAHTLNHTAASRGADVLGAGEAHVRFGRNGSPSIVELNNQPGHYVPSADTLAPAAVVLQQQGMFVLRQRPVPGS